MVFELDHINFNLGSREELRADERLTEEHGSHIREHHDRVDSLLRATSKQMIIREERVRPVLGQFKLGSNKEC
jgi:hypothetical protein